MSLHRVLLRPPSSTTFIHSCGPRPASSISTSTATLFVRFISITNTNLDTLINISSFTEVPEAKNLPLRNRWEEFFNTSFATSF